MGLYDSVQKEDPEVYSAIIKEAGRQEEHIELIASENFVSPAVLEAVGSVLTNKYAEGYPNKRYYGGCEFVDIVEQLAIDRAKELFKAEHANVQPHSGSQANFAAYFALLNAGDTIMGMDLSHGGHLTHGSPVNFSGKFFKVVPYGVSKDTETIDYDNVMKLAKECKPKMIVVGASAYPRIIDFDYFRKAADEAGAYLMVDMAHIAGLVAAGMHPSPVGVSDIVTTTTHKTLRGPRGGMILCKEKYAKAINSQIFPGSQGGPLMHVIAGKAVAFKEAMEPSFKAYQEQIVKNAKALAQAMQKQGFRVVSGGTDNHVMLIDVHSKGLTGKDCQGTLDLVNITTNKNTIPFETLSPFVTSGIRLGTPAVTTRGMKEADMETIAGFIGDTLNNMGDEAKISEVKEKVVAFCNKFPLYRGRLY